MDIPEKETWLNTKCQAIQVIRFYCEGWVVIRELDLTNRIQTSIFHANIVISV